MRLLSIIRKIAKLSREIKIIIGIIVLIVIFVFSRGTFKNGDKITQKDFDELESNKKQEVTSTFDLAKEYFMRSYYAECFSELEKLHGIVSSYKDSRELSVACQKGQEHLLRECEMASDACRLNWRDLSRQAQQNSNQTSAVSKPLSLRLKQQFDKCLSLMKAGKSKEAYLTCYGVLKKAPNNREVKTVVDKSFMQLQGETKLLYEQSRMDESLGQRTAAREKWLRIVNKSVPQDIYYLKAKRLLQLDKVRH